MKKTPQKGVAYYLAVYLAVRPLFTSKTKNKNPVYKLYNTTNQYFTKQKRDNH